MSSAELGGLAASVSLGTPAAAGAAPHLLDPDVTLGSGFVPGGTLTVTGLTSYDRVFVLGMGDAPGQIGVTGNMIRYGGVEIGSFSGGEGATLTITLNASANAAAVDALIGRLAYQLGTGAPADHALHLELIDGAGQAVHQPSVWQPVDGAPANPFSDVSLGSLGNIAFGDVDGDGDIDLVASGSQTLTWVPYDEALSETFISPLFVAKNDTLWMTDLGDPAYSTPRTGLFLNDGSGHLVAAGAAIADAPLDQSDYSVALGDVDKDGDLDLLITHRQISFDYSLEIALNNGQGSFSDPVVANTIFWNHPNDSYTVAAGDVNGDGDLDVLGASVLGTTLITGSGLQWATAVVGSGGRYFPDVLVGGQGESPIHNALVDQDGDGDLDLVTWVEGQGMRFFENVGGFSFAERTGSANPFAFIDGGHTGVPAFADLDGDGDQDLVISRDGGLQVYWNSAPAGYAYAATGANIALDFDPAPLAAVAVNDAATVAEGHSVDVAVLANDSDPDGAPQLAGVQGQALSEGQSVTLASGATVTLVEGALRYDAGSAFDWLVSAATGLATGALSAATDSFSYSLADGATATVTMTITGADSASDRLTGSAGNDVLTGLAGSDLFMLDRGGNDEVSGGGGDDILYFGGAYTSADRVAGGAGTGDSLVLQGNYAAGVGIHTMSGVETLVLMTGSDARYGASGSDRNSYYILFEDSILGAGQQLTVQGNKLLAGEALRFDGSAESDGSFRIIGGAGNDTLSGGAMDDILTGGLGQDFLAGYGGNDMYVYRSAAESTATDPDFINGFNKGDRIDLRQIDASLAHTGDDAFAFIGSDAFHQVAGELRAQNFSGSWQVQGDVDGDGNADFVMIVYAPPGHTIGAADFLL